MNKNTAAVLLTAIVAMWGLSFSLTKPLLGSLGVFNFLMFRFLIGGSVLGIFALVRGNLKVNKSMVMDGVIAGVLLFAVFGLHTLGLKYTTISKNAFIVGGGVLFIPFVKLLFFKEKQTLSTWTQMALATASLALITLVDTTGGLNFGDLVSIAGTILLAFYTIFVEKRIHKHKATPFTVVQLLTVGLLSTAGMLAFEVPNFDLSLAGWGSVLVMGVFLTGLAYVVLNVCQGHLSALKVTVLYTLEPFFAALFGWLLLSEHISGNIALGGVLIFMSMMAPTAMDYLATRNKKTSKRPQVSSY